VATYCGTHGAANDLGNALDAAAQLKAANRTDIVIQLIGSGAEKSALIKRARLEGLDNVRFVDSVPKTQLAEMLAESDIGLQCLANLPAFYYGTSPNKFFDYLSAGLPVLCNYPGWVAQMIEQNNCGFVVPPADPAAFAAALIHAADHRNLLPDMAANATRLGRDQFDRNKLAAQWMKWVVGTPHSIRK
jgi:glycosyltransferase involved in cell wall biosynthesis